MQGCHCPPPATPTPSRDVWSAGRLTRRLSNSNLGFIDICVFVFSTACRLPALPQPPHLFSRSCPRFSTPASPTASRAPSNYSTHSSTSPPPPSPHRLPLSFALSPFPSPLVSPFSTPWPRAFLTGQRHTCISFNSTTHNDYIIFQRRLLLFFSSSPHCYVASLPSLLISLGRPPFGL